MSHDPDVPFIATNTIPGKRKRGDSCERRNLSKTLESNPRTFDPALATDIYSVTVIQQFWWIGPVRQGPQCHSSPREVLEISRTASLIPSSCGGGQIPQCREVTAQDFVYSFSRILDPEIRSSAPIFLQGSWRKGIHGSKSSEVKGLIVKDKYTSTHPLRTLYAFISPGHEGNEVVPKKSGKRGSTSPNLRLNRPFSCLDEEGEEILLEANPDYLKEGLTSTDSSLRSSTGAGKEMLKCSWMAIRRVLHPSDELEMSSGQSYLFTKSYSFTWDFMDWMWRPSPGK